MAVAPMGLYQCTTKHHHLTHPTVGGTLAQKCESIMSKSQQEFNAWLEKVAKIQQRIKDGNEDLMPLDDYIKERECRTKNRHKMEERKRESAKNTTTTK